MMGGTTSLVEAVRKVRRELWGDRKPEAPAPSPAEIEQRRRTREQRRIGDAVREVVLSPEFVRELAKEVAAMTDFITPRWWEPLLSR